MYKILVNLHQTFENNFDKDNLTIKLPHIFNTIITQDARMELVTSNTLCPINLIYQHNYVTKTIATIFVNTECNGIDYTNANESGNTAVKLLKNVLNFDQVEFC